MADSSIITNPNQKAEEQLNQKKKSVFWWTADAFKDGEFLWSNPVKEINNVDENQDFFDPLEELIPLEWEVQWEQINDIKEEVKSDNLESKEESNGDFDLSQEFEPINTSEQNEISQEVNTDKKPEEISPEEIKIEENLLESNEEISQKEEKNKWIEWVIIDKIPEEVEINEVLGNKESKNEEIVDEIGDELEGQGIQKIEEPIEKKENIKKEEIDIKNLEPEPIKKTADEPVVKEEKEEEPEESDLKSKFYELLNIAKKVYEMKDLKKEETFEIVGMKTENQEIVYSTLLGYNAISFDKKESKWGQIDNHNLSFAIKDKELWVSVSIDEEILFTEQKDLLIDEAKQAQVIEKMNKFIFLIEQEIKMIEKNKKEQEEKEKRRWLKWIFRNF